MVVRGVTVASVDHVKSIEGVWRGSSKVEERWCHWCLMTIWWKWDWGSLRSGCVGRLWLRLRCWVGSASRILIDKIVKRIIWIRIVDDWLWWWRCYWIRRMVEALEGWSRRWEVVLRNQRVLSKLWNGMEVWSIIVGGWLNHITNSDDSRVDLVGVDVFQEESMEFWWNEIQGIRIVWRNFKVRNKLKCFVVMCNNSEKIFKKSLKISKFQNTLKKILTFVH